LATFFPVDTIIVGLGKGRPITTFKGRGLMTSSHGSKEEHSVFLTLPVTVVDDGQHLIEGAVILGAAQGQHLVAGELIPPCPRALNWAGAVDTVGGSTLSYLIRTMNHFGNIALCGLVGGPNFAGTVIPFLLCGVNLFWH
jgi:NADPH:quinone reductase-like Zn-dependent oxidoreductase